MNILVVCLGNICRSPMAEGILRKKIIDRQLKIKVDSAGTADYHVGDAPDIRAISAAKIYEIDISGLRGRQFAVNDFDSFDRIYAMDSSNYKNIQKLARKESDRNKISYFLNDGGKGLDVPDPWYGEADDFFSVFNLLDKAADKILDEIKKDVLYNCK